jgi:hypothetical protein
VDTHRAPRLDLKSICEGSRSAGTNKLYITFSSSIKKLAQLSAWPHISNFSGRYSLEYAVNGKLLIHKVPEVSRHLLGATCIIVLKFVVKTRS